jgi:hypothetical protein
MLQIDQRQMEGFQASARQSFEDRGVVHIRSKAPVESTQYSDDALRERIRLCMRRCRAYGLITEAQVMAFVDTSFFLGEWFDLDPAQAWTKEVLQDPELQPNQKAGVLVGFAETVAEGKRA